MCCMHTSRVQDGNRLYQPAERKTFGPIDIKLIREIMVVMCNTRLFEPMVEGKRWVFDPVGAVPDKRTGRVNKGGVACLHLVWHAVVRVAVCVGVSCVSHFVYSHTISNLSPIL